VSRGAAKASNVKVSFQLKAKKICKGSVIAHVGYIQVDSPSGVLKGSTCHALLALENVHSFT